MLRSLGSSISCSRPVTQKSVPARTTETVRRSTTDPGPNVVIIWLGRSSPRMSGGRVPDLLAIDPYDANRAKLLDFPERLRRRPVSPRTPSRDAQENVLGGDLAEIRRSPTVPERVLPV